MSKRWVDEDHPQHPSKWRNRLMIAIPFAELGYSRFWQMLLTVRHIGWHIDHGRMVTATGPYLPDSHTSLVRDALSVEGWDYLCFLEHDHVFMPDLLERMGAYEKPVVGGFYVSRNLTDVQPVAYKWDEQRHSILRYQPYEWDRMLNPRGLHEVDVVPLGCTAIRRDVLEEWPKDVPMFFAPTNPTSGKTMSDDVWFCRQVQDQGWPIHIDTENVVEHLTLVSLSQGHYFAWVEAMRKAGKTGRLEDAS